MKKKRNVGMAERRTNTFTRMNIELNDEEDVERGGRARQVARGGDTQCCNSLDNELWKTGGFSLPFKAVAITSRQPSLLRPFGVFFFSCCSFCRLVLAAILPFWSHRF